MNWYSKSRISTTAAILEDYGISESIWNVIRWMVEKMIVLAGADRLEELVELEWKTGGPVWRETDKTIPSELLEILRDGDYQWYVEFRKSETTSVCYSAGYQPNKNRMVIKFNTFLPLIMSHDILRGNNSWKMQKPQYMRDLARVRHSIRHEVIHLLRDAQTGHIRRYFQRMQNEDIVHEYYMRHGHEELEFEIDAKIAALDSLRRQLGADRFDKLTVGRIYQILPSFRFPREGPALARWIKRLMREGLLTSGMKEAWNL